ncbi:10751_t:CDS:2, partial [Dentiscutata heterogama]
TNGDFPFLTRATFDQLISEFLSNRKPMQQRKTCPLHIKEASEVTVFLFSVFTVFGPPYILQSDNGQEFIAQIIHELLKEDLSNLIEGDEDSENVDNSDYDDFNDTNNYKELLQHVNVSQDKVSESIQTFNDSAVLDDRLLIIPSSQFSIPLSNIIEDDYTIKQCASKDNINKQTHFVNYEDIETSNA